MRLGLIGADLDVTSLSAKSRHLTL